MRLHLAVVYFPSLSLPLALYIPAFLLLPLSKSRLSNSRLSNTTTVLSQPSSPIHLSSLWPHPSSQPPPSPFSGASPKKAATPGRHLSLSSRPACVLAISATTSTQAHPQKALGARYHTSHSSAMGSLNRSPTPP